MKILITGSSGFLGRALAGRLKSSGHELRFLVRRPARSDTEAQWNPAEGRLPAQAVEGVEAVIHLAGEPIISGRWTSTRMDRIRRSRVETTTLLARHLGRMQGPPAVLLSASAIGYYGHRGEAWLDETSSAGRGFLPAVCRDWEAATEPVRGTAIRVCHLRFGVVLSPAGGALKAMLPLFRFGLGGRLGNGNHFMSWIALADALGAMEMLLSAPISGPVNLVSPGPVTNREFTAALAGALRRPALLPAPALVLRMVLGRMADEALLASARVSPRRLLEAGYVFARPEIGSALRTLLKPPALS